MNDSGQNKGAEPMPPVYTKLKALCRTTELVKQGKPNVTLITSTNGVYDAQAFRIQQIIETRSGVKVPIATDDSPAAAVPIQGNLIVLGNRSTNKTIGELYNRYYTLLDLRYPGPEGYVVRSLHNPFGDGRNVVFVGGSDAVGVAAAAEVFIEKGLQADADSRGLSMGWLMEIKLGRGVHVPKEVNDFETWEASAAYGSMGYFGWNSISKRMAMYYMTGEPFHAREALRLAFPDARAKAEIAEIDGERIENKDEPLSGPYHYNAHMMILFWDLIEESPVFSDEERLRVTNAFSNQFGHPQELGWRRQIADDVRKDRMEAYDEPEAKVSSRHGQWSAVALYALGRYFQRDYPSTFWKHCVESAKWQFSSLHHHDWVDGEYDFLAWYSTGMAPILSYMLISGDRAPLENGVLARLLRGQEILVSGREPDWALNAASIGFLHKAAYLMQDGRYRDYLRRTGIDLSVFRVGQSFWPENHLQPELSADLVGKWSIHPIPKPMWESRLSGLPFEDSFLFGSFRNAPDASGDFILIKGMNGAVRNPYHTLVLLQLRLGGQTVLEGYSNQVLTRADGMVEPEVAMDGALRYRDRIGETAVVVGEVPKAAFCTWRRTLTQRMGRYALVVDTLKFRADSEGMEVEILWQGKGTWEAISGGGAVRIEGSGIPFEIRLSDPLETAVEEDHTRMVWRGSVQDGGQKMFFSLIAGDRGVSELPLVCARLEDHAAVLGLPEPAVAVVGEYEGFQGELIVLAQDHLYGMGLTKAALDATLVSAEDPVHVDWDFESGALEGVADADTRIRLTLSDPSEVRMDGEVVHLESGPDDLATFRMPAGRHTFSNVRPDRNVLKKIVGRLESLLRQGKGKRLRSATAKSSPRPDVPTLPTVFTANVGGKVVDLITVPSDEGTQMVAAEGKTVHVLTPDGEEIRTLQTDGPIRVLRWWEEHHLLLTGCVDEKVIAFDAMTGKRQWVFRSEMDPAVFRAAKTYWFKSAPGHEGIHGLHTGVFLDGKSQAFAGSACTLEILDENGALVQRLPVFWGPGSKFALIDGPVGSIHLLIARRPTDWHDLAVVSNRTLDPTPRSFDGVPPGHTYVRGWGGMSHKHIFYEDLDGDGKKKIVGEINGIWNRVTVWAADGTPLYNANFGPGKGEAKILTPHFETVRDLDIVDLDGDGKKEILAALSDGLVIALDSRCDKRWARRLPSPPTVLKGIHGQDASCVVVGCEDGTLVVLNGQGEIIRMDRVTGRPTCIEHLDEGVVLATDRGEVKGVKTKED